MRSDSRLTNEATDILVDRELTAEERRLAEWMLVNGIEEGWTFLNDLAMARVHSHCGCGCASINFLIDGNELPAGGLRVLGDFLLGEGDETSGVFIFERDGLLAGIEVYSFGDQVCTKLPDPSQLRRFDVEKT